MDLLFWPNGMLQCTINDSFSSELTYYDVTIQHISHCAIKVILKTKWFHFCGVAGRVIFIFIENGLGKASLNPKQSCCNSVCTNTSWKGMNPFLLLQSVGLRICWQYPWQKAKTPFPKPCPGITLNIWWWGSSFGNLGNVEYPFIAIAPTSTQLSVRV